MELDVFGLPKENKGVDVFGLPKETSKKLDVFGLPSQSQSVDNTGKFDLLTGEAVPTDIPEPKLNPQITNPTTLSQSINKMSQEQWIDKDRSVKTPGYNPNTPKQVDLRDKVIKTWKEFTQSTANDWAGAYNQAYENKDIIGMIPTSIMGSLTKIIDVLSPSSINEVQEIVGTTSMIGQPAFKAAEKSIKPIFEQIKSHYYSAKKLFPEKSSAEIMTKIEKEIPNIVDDVVVKNLGAEDVKSLLQKNKPTEVITETKVIPQPKTTLKEFNESLKSLGDKNVDDIVNQYDLNLKSQEEVLRGWSWKEIKEKANLRFVDDTANIRQALKKEGSQEAIDAIRDRIATRGASAKAKFEVDKITNDIFKGVTKENKKKLDLFRESQRTTEIELQNLGKEQPIMTQGGIKHKNYVEGVGKVLPEEYAWLEQKSKQIQQVYDDGLKKLKDAGMFKEGEYEDILAKGEHYNPRLIQERIDPGTEVIRGSRKVTVGDSGIEYLDKGSEKALINDSEYLIKNYISRIESRIARNEAGKSLYKVAESNPENGFVRILDDPKYLKTTEDTVRVIIDGEQKLLAMPANLAEEWKGIDPILTQQQAHWLGVLSGSKILKAFATGMNPLFAVRNLPRDIGYVYMQNNLGYSGFIPKFSGQMFIDYAQTFKDAITKKGLAEEYIKNYGGMESLTDQGRLLEKHLTKVQDTLGWFGNFTERWTRLAVTKRGLKEGKPIEDAVIAARDMLDFSQGGTVAKAANNVFPYLNPAIQGTRGIIRSAKNDPAQFTWKLANLMGISTGLYYLNIFNYKDDYDKIPSQTKANNWIIMTPLTTIDKWGEEQRRYLSIPKDQGQRLFTALFDNLASKFMHNEINTEQLGFAAKDTLSFLPTGEGVLSPSMRASLGYAYNKDFWRNRELANEEVRPELQYKTENESEKPTPEIYKKMGSTTKDIPIVPTLSPDKTKYAIEQFFTTSNTFTNYFGLGLNEILKNESPKERADQSKEIEKWIPGIGNLLQTTNSEYLENKKIKELNLEEKSNKLIIKRELDDIDVNDTNGMNEFINKYSDRPEVIKMVATKYTIGDTLNKNWYNKVASLPSDEIKSAIFFDRYNRSTPDVQKIMIEAAARIGGILAPAYTGQAKKDLKNK